MSVKKWLMFFIMISITGVLFVPMAEGGNTLIVTVMYRDSNGVAHPLQGAYVYLRTTQGSLPMDKYFSYPGWPGGRQSPASDANGNITVSNINAYQSYYVRIRKPQGGGLLGAPSPTDYTWTNQGSIYFNLNTVVNLGTVYAVPYNFSVQSILISGQVKGASGKVLPGWPVKAATAPCESGNWGYAHSFNECGSAKYPAFTDSSGNYNISIPAAGTYYVYASPNLNFSNTSYPGGYPTCQTGVGCEACGSYFYYNCPVTVNTSVTGVNVTVPGY